MTLEEYVEEKRKRVANMTLAQARDLIAKTLDHSDMELEFDKAVWMLLNCADEKINGGWVPMVRREPTDEEKAEYLAQNGEELCYMLENKMPLNGQEVLVSSSGYVSEDVFDEDFYNFENQDIENVDAWMPKPKPYKAESEEA